MASRLEEKLPLLSQKLCYTLSFSLSNSSSSISHSRDFNSLRVSMGFPVGYTEVFLPKLFLHTLSFLGFIRKLIFCLFHFLGLSDFLETDVSWSETPAQVPEYPPVSAVLIREILPVMKFGEVGSGGDGDAPESCAVCLYDFEAGEEIRWLTNCKHIFHRSCLDRWMDHDHKTCPLCRTPFVPDELQDEFNQRLWAASGITDFYSEYGTVSGL